MKKLICRIHNTWIENSIKWMGFLLVISSPAGLSVNSSNNRVESAWAIPIIITIVAIWSGPHRRIARWIATPFVCAALFLLILSSLSAPDSQRPIANLISLLSVFFGCVVLLAVWIGARFNLQPQSQRKKVSGIAPNAIRTTLRDLFRKLRPEIQVTSVTGGDRADDSAKWIRFSAYQKRIISVAITLSVISVLFPHWIVENQSGWGRIEWFRPLWDTPEIRRGEVSIFWDVLVCQLIAINLFALLILLNRPSSSWIQVLSRLEKWYRAQYKGRAQAFTRGHWGVNRDVRCAVCGIHSSMPKASSRSDNRCHYCVSSAQTGALASEFLRIVSATSPSARPSNEM